MRGSIPARAGGTPDGDNEANGEDGLVKGGAGQGRTIAKLFDSGRQPRGWEDSKVGTVDSRFRGKDGLGQIPPCGKTLQSSCRSGRLRHKPFPTLAECPGYPVPAGPVPGSVGLFPRTFRAVKPSVVPSCSPACLCPWAPTNNFSENVVVCCQSSKGEKSAAPHAYG